MDDGSDFERARRALSNSWQDGTTLCAPFLSLLPVSGAAVSILVRGAVGQSTVCASDRVAARLDELQFDLGEGPCWDAMWSGSPVLTPDFRRDGRASWPAFGEAVTNGAETAVVTSVFAFPLSIGSLDIGAIDLYSAYSAHLAEEQVAEAAELADVAAWQVLRRILGDELAEQPAYSRREVHQATGMIIGQLDVSLEEASLLLRAHAFAAGRSVRDVANDVVARRIDLSTDGRPDGPTIS
jgi:GAF domain-containing protein